MRRIVGLILLILASWAPAQADPRAQVEAARRNAIENLQAQVLAQPIDRGLFVYDLVERMNGRDALSKTLEQAEQIGGPRWIDEQACQVQMELDGSKLANALVDLVQSDPGRAPLRPEVLRARLAEWQQRRFGATGTSIEASKAAELRPLSDAWSGISDEARSKAVEAARQDAARRVLQSISAIPAGPATLGQLLEQTDTERRLPQWLVSRPVTRVEFRDDRQVELRLSASPDELAQNIRPFVEPALPAPAQWQAVHQQIVEHMAPPVGRGLVAADQQQSALLLLPAQPPAWADRQLSASGSASSEGSRLRTARAAERNATEKLRAQIEQLPLGNNLTLESAMRQRPAMQAALDRVLATARTYKVEYAPEGGATVWVTVDLRDLWSELQMVP